MITKFDVIRSFEQMHKEELNPEYHLSKDNKNILDKDGNNIMTMDTYLDFVRSRDHCNLSAIYSNEGTCDIVYKCEDCGAIIFTGFDERYDPNLKCPICNGDPYTDKFAWTKEQIENDVDKQSYLKMLTNLTKLDNERNARYNKRNLYDDTIFVKKIRLKHHIISISLKCDDFFSTIHYRLMDLHLEIYRANADNAFCETTKVIKIPLSFSYIYHKIQVWNYVRKLKKNSKKEESD